MPRALPQQVALRGSDIPDGKITQLQVPTVTALYVQAGAFTSPVNAGSVAIKLNSLGARVMRGVKDGHPIFRVRIGPFQDVGSADSVLGQVHALGQSDAQIVVDSVTG